MDGSLPGTSIHEIFQARVLEWVAIAFSIGMYVSFQISVFVFLGDIYPGVELLGHMVVLFLVFLETSILFSTVAAPIYISSDSRDRILKQAFIAHVLWAGNCWWYLHLLYPVVIVP